MSGSVTYSEDPLHLLSCKWGAITKAFATLYFPSTHITLPPIKPMTMSSGGIVTMQRAPLLTALVQLAVKWLTSALSFQSLGAHPKGVLPSLSPGDGSICAEEDEEGDRGDGVGRSGAAVEEEEGEKPGDGESDAAAVFRTQSSSFLRDVDDPTSINLPFGQGRHFLASEYWSGWYVSPAHSVHRGPYLPGGQLILRFLGTHILVLPATVYRKHPWSEESGHGSHAPDEFDAGGSALYLRQKHSAWPSHEAFPLGSKNPSRSLPKIDCEYEHPRGLD